MKATKLRGRHTKTLRVWAKENSIKHITLIRITAIRNHVACLMKLIDIHDVFDEALDHSFVFEETLPETRECEVCIYGGLPEDAFKRAKTFILLKRLKEEYLDGILVTDISIETDIGSGIEYEAKL